MNQIVQKVRRRQIRNKKAAANKFSEVPASSGEIGHGSLIHLANISYRLGRSLDFDPMLKRFKNDDEANTMLTKKYRAPFVIPEMV